MQLKFRIVKSSSKYTQKSELQSLRYSKLLEVYL